MHLCVPWNVNGPRASYMRCACTYTYMHTYAQTHPVKILLPLISTDIHTHACMKTSPANGAIRIAHHSLRQAAFAEDVPTGGDHLLFTDVQADRTLLGGQVRTALHDAFDAIGRQLDGFLALLVQMRATCVCIGMGLGGYVKYTRVCELYAHGHIHAFTCLRD